MRMLCMMGMMGMMRMMRSIYGRANNGVRGSERGMSV